MNRQPSRARRYGDSSHAGSGHTATPIQDIKTALVAPVTETTDTSTSSGLGLTMGQFVSIAHHAFEFKTSGGTLLFVEPPDGGPIANSGYEWRVFHAKGDAAYAAIVGPSVTTKTPYIELPDAGSGSGRPKMLGGQGAPANITVGSTFVATAGDVYWRQRASSSLQVLYMCSVGGTPGTWVQVI